MSSNSKPDLKAFVLYLRPLKEGILPATNGDLVHGFLHRAVKAYAPDYVVQWHDYSTYRPFTLSGLIHYQSINGNQGHAASVKLDLNQEYMIRITVLNRKAMEVIEQSLARCSKLYLGSIPFRISGRSMSMHKLTGSADYSNLFCPSSDKGKSSGVNLCLRFLSPTAFKKRRINELFPTPEILFSTLLKKWNYFARDCRKEVIPQEWGRSWMVSKYNLQTRMLDFGSFQQVGFKGELCLRSLPGTEPEIEALGKTLAQFAFFAGVGYATTKGMGTVIVKCD